jgi:hypothetical protein
MNVFSSAQDLSHTLPNLAHYYSEVADKVESVKADYGPEIWDLPKCNTQVIPVR